MRLATRIIAVFLLMIVVHACVASYFTIRNAYTEFELQQRELAERVANTMSALLIDAWRNSGSIGVARLLREDGPTRNLGINVRWVWFEGNIPTSELPLAPQWAWPLAVNSTTVSTIVTDANGDRRLHTYVPFSLAPGRRGGLEFTGSLAPIDRQTSSAVWTALMTTGAVALVSIGVAYTTGMIWLARPLQLLIEKTQRVGVGDFTGPLVMENHDELSELAAAINEMCERLEVQHAAVREESAQRLAALEQLRHADRLKTVGRLAAGIAHELGTPLHVVAGRATLIASGKLSPEEIQRSALTIKSEADRITSIVQQLLTFARRQKTHQQPTDVVALVSDTVELLRPLAEKQHVATVVSSEANRLVTTLDRAQIQQVLTNLMVNGIQAMRDGGKLDITIRELDDTTDGTPHPAIGIVIADQGPGIAAEELSLIFEPFFTTKELGEGTGLGLSIALGIVQEHGGRLDVASQVGQGSTFTVILPRKDSPCLAE